jgi:hypothetical protein
MTSRRKTLLRFALVGVVVAFLLSVVLLRITGQGSHVGAEVQDAVIVVALILWPGQFLLALTDSSHPRPLNATMTLLILSALTNAPLYALYGAVYRRFFSKD